MATPFYRLKKEGFEIAPGCKVLKASQYRELCEAEEIIEQARREASRIEAEARDKYEEMKKQGYRDGLMEGKMEMAQQMISNVANTVNYFASIESKVVEIVMGAVKKIIGSIPSEQLIIQVVKNALAATRNQKQVTIRVSPEEVDAVKSRIDEIMSGFPSISFVEVEADSRLKPGGCVLESDIGTVDASVDVQIEAINRAVAKTFSQKEQAR